MKIIRFPPGVDTRHDTPPKPSLWQRFKDWLSPPKKAQMLTYKNPTHWKLERIRRKARGVL